MLTLNTQIPTALRGAVRSLVKAHPAWNAFITAKGKVSAQALNSELLEFALKYKALTAQIEAVLSATIHPVVGASPYGDDAADDMDAPDWARGSNVLVPLGGASSKALGDALVAAEAITQEERDAVDDAAFDATQDLIDAADARQMTPEENTEIQADVDAMNASVADKILEPVKQLLSPLVRAEIVKALSPVITAANKPAVEVEKIVEVERIVEVAPGEGPRVKALPRARKDKKTTFRTLYPSRAKDIWRDAQLTVWAGAASPAQDPFYVVDHVQMALLMTAIERGTNVWLTGPAATGKSTMPEQACAALGRPFVKIGMTCQTEVESLVGGMGLHNGKTVWEDGALITAMRAPGTVILIDELTFAPAGVQAIIQLVADDHRSITLPTGEVVRAAEGVVFVVADNTAGAGDEGGLYAGTNISNAALVTRFKRMIHVDYLTPKQEAEALANHTRCPMPAAQHMADFVAQARRLPALAGVVVSLRQMVGFVQCVQDGFSSKDAFQTTISSRMPNAEKAAIDALADLTWCDTFDALVTGNTPNIAAPIAQPSNSRAANAFDDQH